MQAGSDHDVKNKKDKEMRDHDQIRNIFVRKN